MEVFTHIEEAAVRGNPVVSFGTFDGLHRGHRQIVDRMLHESSRRGETSVIITFDPHPRKVFGHKVLLLSTLDEKKELVKNSGIENLIVVPFDHAFSKMTPSEFIGLLATRLKPSLMVVGYDSGFGSNRGGSPEFLLEEGKKSGFDVEVVKECVFNDRPISSTFIRNSLMEGSIDEANFMLGYPYPVSGEVVYGNQIGRSMGYPTANLDVKNGDKLLPRMGVYASRVYLGDEIFGGMTNIGFRPTINVSNLTIETNIFDFNRDIYGRTIKVEIIKRLRDELKFDSMDALKHQIRLDEIHSREVLKNYTGPLIP